MHLSKLKLKGFKSFADAAELDLSDGISAIVGPNGSGKSNITDAVRWVLGEQSTKALRGKKMEDVIFAGTEQKAPLSYAEVVLVLDNSDGKLQDYPAQVEVMRRLFRSGESEYRLNKKNCKLRDIQQIFMDTGLGKNGYSLISQGEIEDIINSSPMELRNIVEEAVGIVSYKTRKTEAERKLRQTRENMDRVGDILEELDRRRGPLKRQAKKAKEFIKVHDALKTVDLLRFTERMAQIEDETSQHSRHMMDIQAEINTIQQRLIQSDKRYQERQEKLQKISKEIEDKSASQQNLSQSIGDCKSALLVAKERLLHLDHSEQRLHSEAERISEKVKETEAEKEKLVAEREEILSVLDAIEEEIRQLTAERDTLLNEEEQLRIQLEKQSAQEEKTAIKRSRINETIQQEKEWLSGADVRYDLGQEEYLRLQKEWHVQNEAGKTAEQFIGESSRQLESFRENLETALQKKAAEEALAHQVEEEMNVLSNNMRVNAKQRDYLKRIQENYTDYYPGIQKIMTASTFQEKDRKNIFGPVGELIKVPEIYAKAIEVALGGKTQYIVVASVDTASRCIDFLKTRKAGRATFLPMDNLHFYGVEEKDRNQLAAMDGFLGIASELIRFDAKYRLAVDSLLARTLIVRDFQSAKKISRTIKRYAIVTLDGEIFHVGGAIVGGINKGGRQSPFFKKIEIDRLAAEYADSEKKYRKLNCQCDLCREHLAQLEVQINQYELNIQELEQLIWQQRQKKDNHEKLHQEIFERMRDVEKTQKAMAFELRLKTEKLIALQRKLDELDSLAGRLSDSSPEMSFSEKKEELEQHLAECRIRQAGKKEQLKAEEQRLAQVEKILLNDQNQFTLILEEKNAAAGEKMHLSDLITQQKKELEEKLAMKSEIQESFSAVSAMQSLLNQELAAYSRDIQNLNHELLVQSEARSKMTLLLDRLETEKDHLEEEMYTRYEMNHLMAKDAVKALTVRPEDYSAEQQKKLKRQLSSLGQVNLSAVEEYAEVEDRYSFLKKQIDDLKAAAEELKKIIDTLYQSMENQFAVGFKKLQSIFSEVFAVLFEGGMARLEYTDPENIMESGIELTAQPPGKKLKHISLLSGGETSMTAIALLFSFLQLNPSPFCVIDEIDAALDDGNIQRFTRYMQGLADHIQFMLITHRKKTLEVCDAIYGVTMSKTGISKMVSIRLLDYVEEK